MYRKKLDVCGLEVDWRWSGLEKKMKWIGLDWSGGKEGRLVKNPAPNSLFRTNT